MDKSEFESRVFANPDDNEKDLLDAIQEDPQRQQLVDEVRKFDRQLKESLNDVPLPEGLAARLKTVVNDVDKAWEPAVETAADNVVPFPRRQPLRFAAIAAVLVIAVGISYNSLFPGGQPNAAELAFGRQVIDHVYMELAEIEAPQDEIDFQVVTQAIGGVGASLNSQQAVVELSISFAKPCIVIPQNSSAHLVMDGSFGAVNVIVVNNTPVSKEFKFSDDRFEAVVIPLENGNLILVGEKQESLGDYRRMVADNTSWVI